MLKEMMNSHRILYYVLICCISYTACVLTLSLTNDFINIVLEADYTTTWRSNLEYFVVCASVSVLMFFTDVITDDCYRPISMIIQITDVAVCVFGWGGLVFKWFPLKPFWIMVIFVILLIIYFATFVVMYFVDKKWTDDINKIIIKRKREKRNVAKHN